MRFSPLGGPVMPAETLRAAVVGLNWAGRQHAQTYAQLEGVKLTAVCDVDASALDRVGRWFPNLSRYRDFERMLDEQRPDLLSIATPQRWHAPQTILAATRFPPRAILCEKPMAGGLGQARAMLAACRQHGVKLAIGHMMRWYTVHEQARRLIADGAIGTPLTASASMESGGLMNNGTHTLSYTQYVLGDPDPEWVIANVQRQSDSYERGWPTEELSGALISFAGGVRVSFEGDIPSDPRYDWKLQTVTGTDGVLMWPSQFLATDYAVRVVRRGNGITETPAPTQTLDDVFRCELNGLAQWARGETPENRNDAHLAIKTQEILMAIFESARTHTLVRLPLRTMGSPLTEAIRAGELPVDFPGKYDIRYAVDQPLRSRD